MTAYGSMSAVSCRGISGCIVEKLYLYVNNEKDNVQQAK